MCTVIDGADLFYGTCVVGSRVRDGLYISMPGVLGGAMEGTKIKSECEKKLVVGDGGRWCDAKGLPCLILFLLVASWPGT